MKTVAHTFIGHGLATGAGIKLILALVALLVIYRWTLSLHHDFKYRKLFTLFGQKTEKGHKLKIIKKSNGVFEILDCADDITLSRLESEKEVLERHLHIKISLIQEEKRGFGYWKKSVFIIFGERKIKNYKYQPNQLPLNRGELFLGWDISLSKNVIENTETGAFSLKIAGSSGSGKTFLAFICLDSMVRACKANQEGIEVIIADPKTSFQWAKRKYGATIVNPTTPDGSKKLYGLLKEKYEEIINISEALKAHDIHVEHIKDLTHEQCELAGIIKPRKTVYIFEEFERYWSSEKVSKPTKDASELAKEQYEHYLNNDSAGILANHLLGIGRAYNVVLIFSTQSGLISHISYPAESNIQLFAFSKVSPEVSTRVFGNSRIATSSNCKTGEFILKSDKNGIRKIQIPKFILGGEDE